MLKNQLHAIKVTAICKLIVRVFPLVFVQQIAEILHPEQQNQTLHNSLLRALCLSQLWFWRSDSTVAGFLQSAVCIIYHQIMHIKVGGASSVLLAS